MAKPLVSDELWARIEPELPVVKRRSRYPGRKRPRPAGADGDLVRLEDGDPVGGFAPGDGVRVGDDVLATLEGVERRRCVGSPASRAPRRAPRLRPDRLVTGGGRLLARAGQRGGEQTGPSPVDRSRKASKHRVICAGNGIPLAATVTAANCHDVTQLLELVDRVVPVGAHGKFRPRRCSPTARMTLAVTAPSCADRSPFIGPPLVRVRG